MNSPKVNHLWYLPACLWALVILYLSTGPSSDYPPWLIFGIIPFDKAGHFGAYAIFTITLAVPLFKQYPVTSFRYKVSLYAIGLPVLYGLIMELLQGFVIMDRNLEFYDLVADAVGSLVGFTMVYLAIKQIKLC